jgi:hypothetical protein
MVEHIVSQCHQFQYLPKVQTTFDTSCWRGFLVSRDGYNQIHQSLQTRSCWSSGLALLKFFILDQKRSRPFSYLGQNRLLCCHSLLKSGRVQDLRAATKDWLSRFECTVGSYQPMMQTPSRSRLGVPRLLVQPIPLRAPRCRSSWYSFLLQKQSQQDLSGARSLTSKTGRGHWSLEYSTH